MTPPVTPASAKPPVKPRPKNAQKDYVLLFSEDNVDKHDLHPLHMPDNENPSAEADSPKVKKVHGKGKAKPVLMLVDNPNTNDKKSHKTCFLWNLYEDLLYYVFKHYPTYSNNPTSQVAMKVADQAWNIGLFPPDTSLEEARTVGPQFVCPRSHQ